MDTIPSRQFEVLEDARYIPVVVVGTISSVLSMAGSGCILFMTSQKIRRSIMDRLVFALSIADMTSSIGNLSMPWMIPSYMGLPGAVGSHASCTVAGFLMMTGILAGCLINAYLSMYFFLVVRKSYMERDFNKYWEILGYVLAITLPVAINSAAAATQSINPSTLNNNVCTLARTSWICVEDDDVDNCERSERDVRKTLGYITLSVLLVFSALGFVCTFRVAGGVRRTVRQSISYRFSGDTDNSGEERMRQVSIQAVLYSLAYLNTFFWPLLSVILSSESINSTGELEELRLTPGFYAVVFLYWALYPLQVRYCYI